MRAERSVSLLRWTMAECGWVLLIGGALTILGLLAASVLGFPMTRPIVWDSAVFYLQDGSRLEAHSPEEIELILASERTINSMEFHNSQPPMTASTFVIPICAFFLAVVIHTLLRERAKVARWITPTSAGILLGVAGGLGLVGLGFLYDQAPRYVGAPSFDFTSLFEPLGLSRWFLPALGVGLAPIVEELYFRGRLYDELSERFSLTAAILITALLFGLVHGLLTYLPAYIVFGLVLAGLRFATGGLVAPILAHAINNGVGLLLLNE